MERRDRERNFESESAFTSYPLILQDSLLKVKESIFFVSCFSWSTFNSVRSYHNYCRLSSVSQSPVAQLSVKMKGTTQEITIALITNYPCPISICILLLTIGDTFSVLIEFTITWLMLSKASGICKCIMERTGEESYWNKMERNNFGAKHRGSRGTGTSCQRCFGRSPTFRFFLEVVRLLYLQK